MNEMNNQNLTLEEQGQRYFNRALCSQLGSVFEYACKMERNLPEFAKVFLATGMFDRYLVDYTLFSQSPLYIYEVFSELEEFNTIPEDKTAILDTDAGYWLGYLFVEWHQLHGVTGADILKHNIKYMYTFYDILHTQSIPVAIDRIIEDEYDIDAHVQGEQELI